MTTTAGAGIFGFTGRIVGTFVAMCTSFVIWYIVDGHTAGVLVFFFVLTFIEFYVFIKYPKILVVALLSIVTQGPFSPRLKNKRMSLMRSQS